jgi:hypothetical protein
MNANHQQGTSWVLTDVALVVRGPGLDPDDVTRRLNLRPTGVRRPGPDQRGALGGDDGQWRLQCDERTTRVFSEQFDTILTAAEPHARDMHELMANGNSVTLTVSGYVDNDSQITLTPEQMRRVARLGIPLTLSPSNSER